MVPAKGLLIIDRPERLYLSNIILLRRINHIVVCRPASKGIAGAASEPCRYGEGRFPERAAGGDGHPWNRKRRQYAQAGDSGLSCRERGCRRRRARGCPAAS